LGEGSELILAANLGPEPLRGIDRSFARTIWTEGEAQSGALGPWSLVWAIESV
jgi:hypothetical protein